MNAELVIIGIALPTLMFVWRRMFRRSILDTTRDQLFDLREKAREFYLKDGRSLDSHIYKKLRENINTQIRFLDQSSLMEYAIIARTVREDPELLSSIRKQTASAYATTDQEERDFIASVRSEVATIINARVVMSFLPTALFVLAFIPVILAGLSLALICGHGVGFIKRHVVSIIGVFKTDVIEYAPRHSPAAHPMRPCPT